MLFFDTSALVERYAREPGTETVDALVDSSDDQILITSLGLIEITSAVRQKHNQGDITVQQRDDLLIAFFEEATGGYTILPLDAAVFEIAFDLVLEDDLRTLDARQLGTALSVVTEDRNLVFVSADQKQVIVAQDRGLSAINPLINEGR